MRAVAIVAAALGLLLLLPEQAWAFGPATHVFIGERVLSSLYLLPEAMAALLRAHPQSFLYGSMAADISFAKKYVPAGRHCHFWHVGEEIHDAAENERMQAVGLGYLAHLAADTIAHNFFVPRRLVLTSSSQALGHSYWEHRFDTHLGEPYASLARSVVMDYDHSEADSLFDQVLSGTIFSFETNRRIFRGMIRVQDNDRWKNVFDRVVRNSRWDLNDEVVESYMSRSFNYVIDYLRRRRMSIPAALDPVGDFNLQLAKKVRKMALTEGTWKKGDVLHALANDFFPLPVPEPPFWVERDRATNGTTAP